MTEAKYLGRALGVLSHYQNGNITYLTMVRTNPIGALGFMYVKALKNGLKPETVGDYFIADCLDRLDLDKCGKFSPEEISEIEFNMSEWAICSISASSVIKKLKTKAKMNHTDVANEIGASLPSVRRWSADENATPGDESIKKLIKLYNDRA